MRFLLGEGEGNAMLTLCKQTSHLHLQMTFFSCVITNSFTIEFAMISNFVLLHWVALTSEGAELRTPEMKKLFIHYLSRLSLTGITGKSIGLMRDGPSQGRHTDNHIY